jgi:hypothetical protein
MDLINNILTSLITSTVITSVIIFIFKIWLEARIKNHFEVELIKQRHQYEIELEKLKNELTIKAETTHEITGRKLLIYPKIVELVYRIRNIARELIKAEIKNSVLFDELKARISELQNNLYTYRIDLERDNTFIQIHTYKNMSITFTQLIDDQLHFMAINNSEQAEIIDKKIDSLFNEIESSHRPIIETLSKIGPPLKTIE